MQHLVFNFVTKNDELPIYLPANGEDLNRNMFNFKTSKKRSTWLGIVKYFALDVVFEKLTNHLKSFPH